MDSVSRLQKLIDESKNIVFFGGAGVSTASGIKDFRGKNGLYKKNSLNIDGMPPEYMLSSASIYKGRSDSVTRKQRKALKEYKQMLVEVEEFKKDFNMLKGKKKIKRIYHKDYKTMQDYYTKTLNMWYESKTNYYPSSK